MMKVTDIHKRFGKQEVLKGIDLDVAKGEVVVLLGPSRFGKNDPSCVVLIFWNEQIKRCDSIGRNHHHIAQKQVKRNIDPSTANSDGFPQNYALFQNKTAKEKYHDAIDRDQKQSKETALRTAEAFVESVGSSGTTRFFIPANCQVDNNSVSGSPVRWR